MPSEIVAGKIEEALGDFGLSELFDLGPPFLHFLLDLFDVIFCDIFYICLILYIMLFIDVVSVDTSLIVADPPDTFHPNIERLFYDVIQPPNPIESESPEIGGEEIHRRETEGGGGGGEGGGGRAEGE